MCVVWYDKSAHPQEHGEHEHHVIVIRLDRSDEHRDVLLTRYLISFCQSFDPANNALATARTAGLAYNSGCCSCFSLVCSRCSMVLRRGASFWGLSQEDGRDETLICVRTGAFASSAPPVLSRCRQ